MPGPWLIAWMVLALVVFAVLRSGQTAPYGRHVREGWGPGVPNHIGWFVMELPALVLFWVFVLAEAPDWQTGRVAACVLWTLHYGHRALIFPFRLRTRGKTMPLSVVLMAMAFNAINTFFVGRFIGSADLDAHLLWMMPGAMLFVAGFALNFWADHRLIHLRAPGETTYKIPRGGAFRLISCPNHAGEILEWLGFFLMMPGWPTFAFLLWTMANLVPRALDHHRWYRDRFPDYPADRRAIFPFVL